MEDFQPFIGSDALALGRLSRHELRRYYRPIMPNIYLDKRVQPSLRQRVNAAHLWSRGEAVVSGLPASALHGAKWIDDDTPVELIWANARPPKGVITRKELLLENEFQEFDDLVVTTPERTGFDLGRRGRLDDAVARLDALARATDLNVEAIEELAARHRHTRGLRQLEEALDLVDTGAESPRETWLRLMLIRDGYPRPETQIPLLSPDGSRRYYLDMGWRKLMLAVETKAIIIGLLASFSPTRSNAPRTSAISDGSLYEWPHATIRRRYFAVSDAHGTREPVDPAISAAASRNLPPRTQSQRSGTLATPAAR